MIAHSLGSVTLLKHTHRISELMLRADLAIVAGGSTSWERCCLGLPSIAISVADNQLLASQALADHGYQIYLGTSEYVTEKTIADAIRSCMGDFSAMVAMGRRSMELVDGLGAERVAGAMRDSGA